MLSIEEFLDRVTGTPPRPKKGLDRHDEDVYRDVLVRLTDGMRRTRETQGVALVRVSDDERNIINAALTQIIADIVQCLGATTDGTEAKHVQIDMHPEGHPDAVEVRIY